MKNACKSIILVLAIAFVFTACNKTTITHISSNPGGDAYNMSFSYNDTTKLYNTCYVSIVKATGAPSQIIITGLNIGTTGIPGADAFEIAMVQDSGKITAGQVYTATTNVVQTQNASLYFFPDTLHTYITQTAKPAATITITEVNSTDIKGTFSGRIYGEADLNATGFNYLITNGSFTAKQ